MNNTDSLYPKHNDPLEKLLSSKTLKLLFRVILIFSLTLAATISAYQIGYTVNNVVTIWPATGVIYWAIYRYRLTGAITTFVAGSLHGIYWIDAPLINIFIPLFSSICAWYAIILERSRNHNNEIFMDVSHFFTFLIFGLGFYSLSLALVGNIFIHIEYNVPWNLYGQNLWNWFLADFTGGLMLSPLLLTLPLWRNRVKGDYKKTTLLFGVFLVFFFALYLLIDSGIMDEYGTFSPVFFTLPGILYLSMNSKTTDCFLLFFVFTLFSLLFLASGNSDQDNIGVRTLELYLTILLICGIALRVLRHSFNMLIQELTYKNNELEQQVNDRTAKLNAQLNEKSILVKKMKRLASIDALTNLFNRHHFNELASRDFKIAQRNKIPISLCILDIDFFKKVNDTYGHSAGDIVLKELAQLLQQETREGGDSVVRWGGEEFVILMLGQDLTTANNVCERIRNKIARHIFYIDEEKKKIINITISIGIVQCSLEEDALTQCLVVADQYLYQAKANGRNCIVNKDNAIGSVV